MHFDYFWIYFIDIGWIRNLFRVLIEPWHIVFLFNLHISVNETIVQHYDAISFTQKNRKVYYSTATIRLFCCVSMCISKCHMPLKLTIMTVWSVRTAFWRPISLIIYRYLYFMRRFWCWDQNKCTRLEFKWPIICWCWWWWRCWTATTTNVNAKRQLKNRHHCDLGCYLAKFSVLGIHSIRSASVSKRHCHWLFDVIVLMWRIK